MSEFSQLLAKLRAEALDHVSELDSLASEAEKLLPAAAQVPVDAVVAAVLPEVEAILRRVLAGPQPVSPPTAEVPPPPAVGVTATNVPGIGIAPA